MDLRTLRSFVVLAEHAHFTRAASELGIVQPALSKHIHALEDELGVRLFDRTRRSVRLSRDGAQLLEPARRVLEAADQVRGIAARLREGALGHLQIGFTPTAPAMLLARVVEVFRRRHPHVACLVTQSSSEELLDAIERGTLDAALVRLETARRRPAIACVPVFDEPFVAALPRRHRLARRRTIAFADLAGEPFVLVRRAAAASVHDRILAACCAAGFTPSTLQHLHDAHAVVAVVSTGLGVGIVPASTRRPAGVVYRPLVEPSLATVLGVATAAASAGANVRAFVDLVRAAALASAPRG